MSDINTFKNKLKGGGARANQFKVVMNFPTWASIDGATNDFAFFCTATTTPASTVAEVPVAFRGRTLYVAGDRSFATWDTTIINDTDFKIYRAVEKWLNGMNDLKFNTSSHLDPDSYQMDATIKHLDRNNAVLKEWTFRGCMPTALPGIALDYSDNDKIETFDVTWRYQWFEMTGAGESYGTGAAGL